MKPMLGRILLHAAILFVVFRLAYLAGVDRDPEPPVERPYCRGGGFEAVPPETMEQRIRRVFPEVAFFVWESVCAGIAVALFLGLRLVDCRLCRGAGQLALEATPPGEDCFIVDQDCVGCNGAGRLAALDRWGRA